MNACGRWNKDSTDTIQILEKSIDSGSTINSVGKLVSKIDSLDAFCLMPGVIIMSGRMLLDILRWQPMLGASDEMLEALIVALQVIKDPKTLLQKKPLYPRFH